MSDIANPSDAMEEMGFMFTDGVTAGANCLASSFHSSANTNDLSVAGVAVTAGNTYYLIVVLDGFDSSPEETFCVQIDVPCGNSAALSYTPVALGS